MNLIERSIRQPVAVTVAVLLVLIFGSLGLLGIYDFLRLPVQLTPNVDQPMISVQTTWFGASPQEIEQEVIREQEEVLKTVTGLREMTSNSVEGMGTINLQFYVGVDKDAALNEVRDKLRQVRRYPPDVDQPIVQSVDSAADNFIAWMVLRPVAGATPLPPEQVGIAGYHGNVSELQDFMEDEVKPILERVEGIATINVLGGRNREMHVRVDLEQLAARGITISQLISALNAENLNVTAGVVSEGKRDTSIRAVGQYTDPEQIRSTVIAYTAAGAPVYVGDVAEVELGFRRAVGFVRSLGEEVMALNAKRQTGSNVLTVMQGLRQAVQRVNRDILAARGLALELYQVYDESAYVSRSLENARGDLLIGASLAAMVLFMALRSLGATFVVIVAIPIAILGTFFGLALAGRNLNVISMAGLTFSVGIGIDNAIVVLENIFRHREMGKSRFQAALDGAREVWGAIVASIATNVAVFAPILFIEEEAGQLFRDIAVAITISMVLYLLVSPLVVPMLSNLLIRRLPGGYSAEGEAGRPQTLLGRITRPIGRLGAGMAEAFYAVILWLTGGLLRRVVLVVTMVGLATWASFALMPPRTYLPPGNQNLVFAALVSPPGYNIDEFRRMAEHVEQRLRPWWEAELDSPQLAQLQQQFRAVVESAVIPMLQQQAEGMRGGLAAIQQQLQQMRSSMPANQYQQASAELRENALRLQGQIAELEQRIASIRSLPPPAPIENFFFAAFQGRAFMGATSKDPQNVAPLVQVLNGSLQGIPGTMGFAQQAPIFRTGRSIGTTVDVIVSGLDYDQVRSSATALQVALMQRFGTFVMSDPLNFNLGRPERQVLPDRERAAQARVPTPTIRDMAQVAADGRIIGDYRIGGQNIDLVVIAKRPTNDDPEFLRSVPLVATDGRIVPLASVARFIDTSAAQQINRVERQPSVMLNVQLPTSETLQQASAKIEQVIAALREQGAIPLSVTTSFTGSADKMNQFMRTFIPGFILAGIVTFLLLAALFESFLYPFVIMMSVPFAMVGGFLGLWILHVQTGALFDVLTMLGFVILIGIIVNSPILIVHQALNFMSYGMDRQHAIAKSTQTRVRPIFMSVATSVAAMAPLVVLGGAGSELYRGLGAVVVGGLTLSAFFTLFFTPTLMSLMMDIQQWLRRLLHREGGAQPPAPRKPAPARRPHEQEPADLAADLVARRAAENT